MAQPPVSHTWKSPGTEESGDYSSKLELRESETQHELNHSHHSVATVQNMAQGSEKGLALHFKSTKYAFELCPHHCSEIMLVHVPRDSHAARAKHHFVVILPATKLTPLLAELGMVSLSSYTPFILLTHLAPCLLLTSSSWLVFISFAPKAGTQSSYI